MTGLGHQPAGGDDGLVAAIRSGLVASGATPVDSERLLAGARVGARRIRRRRALGAIVAALVVVPGLPLVLTHARLIDRLAPGNGPAGQVALPGAALPGAALPGAALPGAALPTASGATQPGGPSGSPLANGPGTVSLTGGAPSSGAITADTGPMLPRTPQGHVTIPDGILLLPGDLPQASLRLARDNGEALDVAATVEPVCGAQPVAEIAGGRLVEYTGDGPAQGRWELSAVVQVVVGQGATEQLDWLRRELGSCQGGLALDQAPVSVPPGDGAVLGYQVGALPDRPGDVLVVGVIRQGRTLVGVRLVLPESVAADAEERVALARAEGHRLLMLAGQRLRDSGLVEGADADVTLR